MGASCCVWKGWGSGEWLLKTPAFIPQLRMVSGLCFSLDFLQGAKCGVRRQGAPHLPSTGEMSRTLELTWASPPFRVGTSSVLDGRVVSLSATSFPLDSSTQSLPCAQLPAYHSLLRRLNYRRTQRSPSPHSNFPSRRSAGGVGKEPWPRNPKRQASPAAPLILALWLLLSAWGILQRCLCPAVCSHWKLLCPLSWLPTSASYVQAVLFPPSSATRTVQRLSHVLAFSPTYISLQAQ